MVAGLNSDSVALVGTLAHHTTSHIQHHRSCIASSCLASTKSLAISAANIDSIGVYKWVTRSRILQNNFREIWALINIIYIQLHVFSKHFIDDIPQGASWRQTLASTYMFIQNCYMANITVQSVFYYHFIYIYSMHVVHTHYSHWLKYMTMQLTVQVTLIRFCAEIRLVAVKAAGSIEQRWENQLKHYNWRDGVDLFS